jgi:predicted dinucleotide-binding enzyme
MLTAVNVTVIGAGRLGNAVAPAWRNAGHEVTLTSSRGADELARVCRSADVLVLAVPFEAVRELAGALPATGKVVLDATNGGGDAERSGSERIADALGGARVVKALNTVFAPEYAAVAAAPGTASMFYCGNDAGAKAAVATLIEDLGFEAVDAGPLLSARLIESFATLLIGVAYRVGRGPFTYRLSPPRGG